MTLQDKIAVITGASGGIGAATARLLSRQGATVILMGRSERKLEETLASLTGRHDSFLLDVTSTEQVFVVMDQVVERYGRIDILINNAGYGVFEPFSEASLETIGGMMDVNYMGTVRCTKAVLPHMLRAGSGHIVNVASMAGKVGSAKSAGYSATKHAVIGFTNCLRQELKGSGVYISAVNPGPVDTPFFDIADPSGTYANNVRWFMLKPEQVARAVVDVIRHRKRERNIPFVAGLGVKIYQLFPGLFDRIAYRMLNQK